MEAQPRIEMTIDVIYDDVMKEFKVYSISEQLNVRALLLTQTVEDIKKSLKINMAQHLTSLSQSPIFTKQVEPLVHIGKNPSLSSEETLAEEILDRSEVVKNS
jgi:hypothetical protein